MKLSEKVSTDFVSENTQTTNNSLSKELQSNLPLKNLKMKSVFRQIETETKSKNRKTVDDTDNWYDKRLEESLFPGELSIFQKT